MKEWNSLRDLKTNKTHSKKYSVIIPMEIAEMINLEIFESKDHPHSENNVITLYKFYRI